MEPADRLAASPRSTAAASRRVKNAPRSAAFLLAIRRGGGRFSPVAAEPRLRSLGCGGGGMGRMAYERWELTPMSCDCGVFCYYETANVATPPPP
jgi:hypothetical protein